MGLIRIEIKENKKKVFQRTVVEYPFFIKRKTNLKLMTKKNLLKLNPFL